MKRALRRMNHAKKVNHSILGVFRITIQRSFASLVDLPEPKLWEHILDSSTLLNSRLIVHVRPAGFFSFFGFRKTKETLSRCVLTKKGYLIVYANEKELKGHAVNLRLAENIRCSVEKSKKHSCQLTILWKFGEIIFSLFGDQCRPIFLKCNNCFPPLELPQMNCLHLVKACPLRPFLLLWTILHSRTCLCPPVIFPSWCLLQFLLVPIELMGMGYQTSSDVCNAVASPRVWPWMHPSMVLERLVGKAYSLASQVFEPLAVGYTIGSGSPLMLTYGRSASHNDESSQSVDNEFFPSALTPVSNQSLLSKASMSAPTDEEYSPLLSSACFSESDACCSDERHKNGNQLMVDGALSYCSCIFNWRKQFFESQC
uniref:DUF7778 domain-containing protein n=1 Tax=Ditylenchus dipsaci TaxID=166011 RepID=A0A915EJ76_9BILA